jgi:hypothetical protein
MTYRAVIETCPESRCPCWTFILFEGKVLPDPRGCTLRPGHEGEHQHTLSPYPGYTVQEWKEAPMPPSSKERAAKIREELRLLDAAPVYDSARIQEKMEELRLLAHQEVPGTGGTGAATLAYHGYIQILLNRVKYSELKPAT